MTLLFAQMNHAQGQRGMPAVPFRGCASSGQTESLDAPKGTSRSVSISVGDARMLEYYESADGIRLLAPRGWFCQGLSGSGGAALFLSPTPIHYTTAGWVGIDGPVIEHNLINGENSGRYDIARTIARVFPAYMAFARETLDQMEIPVPPGPFPGDRLQRTNTTTVEFTTPAWTEGLGNFDSWIGKNGDPISGAAILSIDPKDPIRNIPHAVILSIRVPQELKRLTPAIIHSVEGDFSKSK